VERDRVLQEARDLIEATGDKRQSAIFLDALGAVQRPEQARTATNGLYMMEVFPALALLSLNTAFFESRKAPKYNPGRRKTFLTADWVAVAEAAARKSHSLGCEELGGGVAPPGEMYSRGSRTRIRWIPPYAC
jgi:predicted RNase H-like nuclease